MNYKVRTPCEKLFPTCYGDKPRIYASKVEAQKRCDELNLDKSPVDLSVLGTFSVIETMLPLEKPPEPKV